MNDFRIDRCVLGVVSTNCYIVYRDTEEELKPGVVIDPGDNAPFILNRCRELGVRHQAVLLTHGHFDHILAAEDVRRTFHIPVMASEEEMSLLEEPDMNLTGSFGDDLCLTADRWLRDGETLELMGCRWKVIHTPGHTSGSVCYYIEDEKVLFSGDTLFCESVGRTDLPTGSPADIIDSVIRKLFVLPEETRVYPGHDSATAIGHERQYNVISRSRR